MDAAARIMRKTIKKKIAGEIPAIRVPPFNIPYRFWLALNRNMRTLNSAPLSHFFAIFW
jgi:hypothetical protein